jgi:HlyD family secretion protein
LRAQLEQIKASVDQAQANLNFQEATHNRLKPLYDKNLIARADYDQAMFNYENSKASLNNAKSSLARAKVNLEYATIYFPIDGVVLNRAIEEGQTVAASFNTPELFTIVNDLTQMEVQTSVDEADIGKVQKGQRVEFTVDAYPELKFEGSVSQVRLQPVTTNNVVTYVVILNAPNPDKKLMPGMTASATIFIKEKNNTLIIPGKAIRFTPDLEYLKKMKASNAGTTGVSGPSEGFQEVNLPSVGAASGLPSGMADPETFTGMEGAKKMVWIKDEKAGLKPVPVVTGIENGSSVEILNGLKEGDEMVTAMSTKV